MYKNSFEKYSNFEEFSKMIGRYLKDGYSGQFTDIVSKFSIDILKYLEKTGCDLKKIIEKSYQDDCNWDYDNYSKFDEVQNYRF